MDRVLRLSKKCLGPATEAVLWCWYRDIRSVSHLLLVNMRRTLSWSTCRMSSSKTSNPCTVSSAMHHLYCRWVLRGAMWGSKQAWFYLHIISQVVGMALFTAGFVVANLKFESSTDRVRDAHANLGIAVMAMTGLQVRPICT